jgi:hypothetical protein
MLFDAHSRVCVLLFDIAGTGLGGDSIWKAPFPDEIQAHLGVIICCCFEFFNFNQFSTTTHTRSIINVVYYRWQIVVRIQIKASQLDFLQFSFVVVVVVVVMMIKFCFFVIK